MNPNAYLTNSQLPHLQTARIGIAGAGGLGSNCAMHLVRAGLSRFVIVDFDRVSASNLNRQFYFADQLDQFKTLALRTNLLRINPDLDLTLHTQRVTAENAWALFDTCNIIVEAFDAEASKHMLISTLLPYGKPLVAATGLAGFGQSNEMRVRKFGSTLYVVGDGVSAVSAEKQSFPSSPRVGIAAAMQANTVMAILLGAPL